MSELNESPVPDVSSYEVRYTGRVIQQGLSRMAYHIGTATRSFSHLYVVVVLDGALYVGADLTRHLHPNVTIGFVRAKSYGDSQVAGGGEALHVELIGDVKNWSLKGQAVLIVDDIYDSGKTMEQLKGLFEGLGAKRVFTSSLIYRGAANEFDMDEKRKPDFFAFQTTDQDFFVGYGLDDKGRARNMRSVYTIPPLKFEEQE